MTSQTADHQCCKVPLVERLRRVPEGAIFCDVDEGNWSTSMHPVGVMCHEAAAEIDRLNFIQREFHNIDDVAEIKRLQDELADVTRDSEQWAGKAGTFAGEADRLRERLALTYEALTGMHRSTMPTPPDVACEHEWVSARNEVVVSGEICKKCHAIRAEQDTRP